MVVSSLAVRRLAYLPVTLAGFGLAGCAGATDDLPRKAISGRVTLDGQPLARGSIAFDPADQGQQHPVSVGAAIEGGSFAIPAATGPTPGKYRVAILAPDAAAEAALPESPGAPPKRSQAKVGAIPDRYNARSTLSADVTPGGPNSFTYELTSK
jgi:hypothetical protein